MWQEVFFFVYHLRMSEREALRLPVRKRKWYAQRFIQQKDMEREYMERQRQQAKAKH